jgi:hypothetical protein
MFPAALNCNQCEHTRLAEPTESQKSVIAYTMPEIANHLYYDRNR